MPSADPAAAVPVPAGPGQHPDRRQVAVDGGHPRRPLHRHVAGVRRRLDADRELQRGPRGGGGGGGRGRG